MWSKLREHLDTPLSDVIYNSEVSWEVCLLEGFTLSTAGKKPPVWRLDAEAWAEHVRYGEPFEWGSLIVPFEKPHSTSKRIVLSSTDELLKTTKAWDQNLRFAIHTAKFQAFTNVATDALKEFRETLETARVLLDLIDHFRAARGKDPLDKHEGNHAQLPDSKTRHSAGQSCELCWRPTMRAEAMHRLSGVPLIKSRHFSDRFCLEHDPSNPDSRYRVDHRYKELYQEEKRQRINPGFLARLGLPPPATGEEAKKDMYNRVHARLRPFTQPDKPSFRELVWDLHAKGKRQADIARELGTSRQSISRSLKRTKKMADTFLERREPRPKRTDYGCWSKQSMLLDSVAILEEDGFTPAEMEELHRVPIHIIHAMLQWLSDNPLPEERTAQAKKIRA
ncbi:hypothetical protein LPB72_05990 [Hydrogenophaga crassostreae]|uniref:Uncharacterized protein n=2 Tax=Hydrogenophaga crassostreae TaxID=1763535 RepID=A0A167IJM9_9BURK|nr:hypothetical protein LPB072_18560 [Hydrogenophaga crassostreae]OAD43049.1 hypothetical protein LPB72_05990 [Hydrogenophaga crassostreae]